MFTMPDSYRHDRPIYRPMLLIQCQDVAGHNREHTNLMWGRWCNETDGNFSQGWDYDNKYRTGWVSVHNSVPLQLKEHRIVGSDASAYGKLQVMLDEEPGMWDSGIPGEIITVLMTCQGE